MYAGNAVSTQAATNWGQSILANYANGGASGDTGTFDNPFSSITGGRKNIQNRYEINLPTVTFYEQYISMCDVVVKCIDKIVSMALNQIKVKVTIGNTVYHASRALEEFIEHIFKPFALEAAKKAFCSGLIIWKKGPLSFELSNKSKDIPRAQLLPNGSHRAFVIIKNYEKTFAATLQKMGYSGNTRLPDFTHDDLPYSTKQVFITPIPGWEPDDFGNLKSPIASIIDTLHAYNELWRGEVKSAENINSPLLVFGSREQKLTSGSDLLAQGGINPDIIYNYHSEERKILDKERLHNYQLSQCYAHVYNIYGPGAGNDMMDVLTKYSTASRRGAGSIERFGPPAGAGNVSKFMQNSYFNFGNTELQQVVQPNTLSDFSGTQQSLLARITETLGVPSQMYFNSGVTVHAEFAGELRRTLEENVKGVQKKLSEAFSTIMTELLSEFIEKENIEAVWFAEEEKGKALTDEEIEIFRKMIKVEVELDFEATMTLEDLIVLKEQFVISQEKFNELAAKVTGIPASDILKPQEYNKEALLKRKLFELSNPEPEKPQQPGADSKNKPKSASSAAKPKSSSTGSASKPAKKKPKTASESSSGSSTKPSKPSSANSGSSSSNSSSKKGNSSGSSSSSSSSDTKNSTASSNKTKKGEGSKKDKEKGDKDKKKSEKKDDEKDASKKKKNEKGDKQDKESKNDSSKKGKEKKKKSNDKGQDEDKDKDKEDKNEENSKSEKKQKKKKESDKEEDSKEDKDDKKDKEDKEKEKKQKEKKKNKK